MNDWGAAVPELTREHLLTALQHRGSSPDAVMWVYGDTSHVTAGRLGEDFDAVYAERLALQGDQAQPAPVGFLRWAGVKLYDRQTHRSAGLIFPCGPNCPCRIPPEERLYREVEVDAWAWERRAPRVDPWRADG